MFSQPRARIVTSICLAAASSLLCLFPLFAAKPGGGGGGGGSVPAGRIYFYANGYWTMNADGKDKRREAYGPAGRSHLTHALHDGHRWYLELRDSSIGAAGALYAVRTDGTDATLLLDAAELPVEASLSFPCWAKDDSFFSFVASETEPAVSTICMVGVSFDTESGQPIVTTLPVPVVSVESVGETGLCGPHDWSPDGSEVVYAEMTDDELNGILFPISITNVVTNTTRLLSDDGIDPFWSPDGTKIVFLGAGMQVINSDGTGRISLGAGYPEGWSPDSKHVVFTSSFEKNGVSFADVMRVPAAGGAATNLTRDLDGVAYPLFWR
jgi:hypothetical protein